MLKSVRVAFVAGLLAAAAFPLTFHIDALAQSGGSGGSGGSAGSGGSGSGGAGSGGSGAGGTNTGSSGTTGSGTTGSGTSGGTAGTGSGAGTAEGGAGTQRTLPGSNATTGTPVNRNDAPAARSATPSSPVARVNSQDYVDTVGSSDMFEVASSQLALERSSNQRVQTFARKMVSDHQQATQKVSQALSASGSNLKPPSQMNAEHRRMLERLRGAKGAAFDRMYLDMQVRGHERALAFHRAYANTGDNPALQAMAREMTPVVQQHLTEVRQIAGTDRGQSRGKGEKRETGS